VLRDHCEEIVLDASLPYRTSNGEGPKKSSYWAIGPSAYERRTPNE
jgi:hypothetical protein